MQTFRLAASGALLLLAVACSGDDKQPTAALSSTTTAFSDRALSAKATDVRARVATVRQRHLNGDEKARVASLKGRWQWVADLHHAAMQDAMHDPSLHHHKVFTADEKCALATRLMAKYSPALETRTGRHYASDADRLNAMKSRAVRSGICSSVTSQASLFTFATTPATTIAPDQIGSVQTYISAMVADIRNAKDLDDANEIMDSYLATASADPDVSTVSLSLIAGTIDLGASSAAEWDAYGRTLQGSLFIWGWLSAIGDWIADVVTADIGGCASGVYSDFPAAMGFDPSLGWDFVDIEGAGCAYDGIMNSLSAGIGFVD